MDHDSDGEVEVLWGSCLESDSNTVKANIVSNHTGYDGGENFEHDDTGAIANYSGVEDDVNNALKEHEDWKQGYDY